VKVTNVVEQHNGWTRFHLSVGGFVVKNCRWHVPTGRIFFPRRYDTNKQRHPVVFAYGAQVKRLRDLLLSGEAATPRDRRPCTLKIHGFGPGELNEYGQRWFIFNFTVRGFTILGCRWLPETGSIQLPVTFVYAGLGTYRKKKIVCAYGAHINRLREYLQAEWVKQYALQEEALA
jgi:hypothetical protein